MKVIYSEYEKEALNELNLWGKKMLQKPSFSSQLTKALQDKLNGLVPEKVHKVVTAAIKNMIQAVLIGSKFITKGPLPDQSLLEREKLVQKKSGFYKKAAMASGAGTGAGGFFLGLADFPILLSLKMKFLFDTASIYGYNVKDFKERVYILYIFQLAFSSHEKRTEVFEIINNWNSYSKQLPEKVEDFNWRSFQQEYRDYIDLPKMLQLIPGFGAIVGAYANFKFIEKLAVTAMNAYRMRLLTSKGNF
ncbi:MAG: EcsC family protein [Bacteroidota bacterium]